MKLSDEMLSAFLDGALTEPEMEQVRQQLQQDDQLTERLAELAMVDSIVQDHYQQIDQQPMPAEVLRLLDNPEPQTPAEVIAFPWWRQAQQQLQRHAAAVACIALVAGFGLSQLTTTPGSRVAMIDAEVLQLLNSAGSGQTYLINNNEQLTPQLSFVNQQGDFCRQYRLQSDKQLTESIACRHQGQWQPQASFSIAHSSIVHSSDSSLYQTASAGGPLDSVLDQLMTGPALNATAEQQYLTVKPR